MKLELPTSGTAGLQFVENVVADRARVSKGLESALESASAGVGGIRPTLGSASR